MSYFSHKIKQERESRDLKQKDVADALNISVSSLSRLENGVNVPRIEDLQMFSDYYQIPVLDLIEESGSDKKGIKITFFQKHQRVLTVLFVFTSFVIGVALGIHVPKDDGSFHGGSYRGTYMIENSSDYFYNNWISLTDDDECLYYVSKDAMNTIQGKYKVIAEDVLELDGGYYDGCTVIMTGEGLRIIDREMNTVTNYTKGSTSSTIIGDIEEE